MGDELGAAIRGRLDTEGKLSCARAFQIARELEVEPLVVGQAADSLGVRLNRCQLGLFGYGPKAEGKHKIVQPAPVVPPDLEQAIEDRVEDGFLSCRAAWDIAAGIGIPKMEVSAAAETMGVKISCCQLGAF